jgi:hypothetical protein
VRGADVAHAWLALQIAGLLAVAAAVWVLAGWSWSLLFLGAAAVVVGEVKS